MILQDDDCAMYETCRPPPQGITAGIHGRVSPRDDIQEVLDLSLRMRT